MENLKCANVYVGEFKAFREPDNAYCISRDTTAVNCKCFEF